jgi:hypothetical protein
MAMFRNFAEPGLIPHSSSLIPRKGFTTLKKLGKFDSVINPVFMIKKILLLFLILVSCSESKKELITPLQKKNFTNPTTYKELKSFVSELDSASRIVTSETIGESVNARNLYALKFSKTEVGADKSKIKVLIIAQQHGNEQSGKEGALLLANDLIKEENKYLFDRLDIVIVPLVNPDGSEENKRVNGNEMDLNRNHLILSEPETQAIHSLFDKYLFEVTMDVHEYFPYTEKWKKFGYMENTDEFLGVTNNVNISQKIRDLSNNSFLPFWKKYLSERKFSNFVYSPGGPPEIDYIRNSTFDINDGRQSFGIQNTISFIQEGLNGKDNFAENIRHRAEGQATGIRALLEFAYQNNETIKNTVSEERLKLVNETPGTMVSIQSEHVKTGEKLHLPMHSFSTNSDTIIIVNDYRPLVKSIWDVKKPSGYLIPSQMSDLVKWISNHGLKSFPYIKEATDRIEQYEITRIDSIDFERDIIVNPITTMKEKEASFDPKGYIYIPTAQLDGNMIVIALEPKSMLGLVTYKQFSSLLKPGEDFPILRAIKQQ